MNGMHADQLTAVLLMAAEAACADGNVARCSAAVDAGRGIDDK
jgi:hypothetical protein